MAVERHNHYEINTVKNKKAIKRKRGIIKVSVLMLAAVVLFAGMLGSSFAWLTAKSETVVNTFTYGDISIKLTEKDTGLDQDNDVTTNDYKMYPGQIIEKDPLVTVHKGSEASWLFIKLEHSANFFDFIEQYELAKDDQNENIWTLLKKEGNTAIYYRAVDAIPAEAQNDLTFRVFENDMLTVKNISKHELTDLEDSTYPRLTITAYAVQRDAKIEAIDTAAEAWELADAESSR